MRMFQICWRSGMAYGITIVLASLLGSTPALAAGFGAYFDYGWTWGQMESCFSFSCVSGVDRNWDRSKIGVGFAFDTNVAQDRLFNYRLNLGYQGVEQVWRDTGSKQDLDGFAMLHSFGFALVRQEHFRIWAGPAIRIGVTLPDSTMFMGTKLYDFFDLEVGGGVQVGFNYHIGDLLSLSLAPVYQYTSVFRFDANRDNALQGGEHVLSLNLSAFIRTPGDRFK